MGEVRALHHRGVAREQRRPGFAAAADAWLTAHTIAGAWSSGTETKYRQTVDALTRELTRGRHGHDLVDGLLEDVGVLDDVAGADQLAAAFAAAFGTLAPATRLRHLSTLRSALGWWRAAGWLASDPSAGWPAPKVTIDSTRALTREQVAALWRLDGVAVRERTLWRLLYETAARAEEILLLDVSDLDFSAKRARVTSKGGNVEWVYWQTGAAMLLPRLLAGRRAGPVFLADRRPTRVTAAGDLCPVTGHARLSYRRAAELFAAGTAAGAAAGAAGSGEGWTLHQLRHSALTHEAEAGTNTPLLLARSRHASIRSLQRYARPGPDAVAAHLAATDPAARRRQQGRRP